MEINNNLELKDTNNNIEVRKKQTVSEITESLLIDVRNELLKNDYISVPIAELATLGAGVSSLIPTFNTISQTMTIPTDGLYRLANAGVGDTLKIAKNGNFWGAFKTAEGKSKFAKLQSVEPITTTQNTVMPIDPATTMMAVALYSIEKQLGEITEVQKQILSFLEIERESAIEADVETLTSIITKYKVSWNDEHFIASNHKLVIDVQRTARKNILSFQKEINDFLNKKLKLISKVQVNNMLGELLKKFKYYRLAIYTFSLASMLEIMLSGNFKEESIGCAKNEIEKISNVYREVYAKGSLYLEKISKSSIETNVLKGISKASRSVGKFIESIPVIKEGSVDEFLMDGASQLKENAIKMENGVIRSFAEISNPETAIFIKEMNILTQIYGHTQNICFDNKNLYLVS